MHFHVNFGETERDGYHICDCGAKTMLISALNCWTVDEEAFKSGEHTCDMPDVPDEVEIGEEVTGHYCPKCERLTSLSVNR